jgi:uncharacterized membrane-anchored protein YitT (DUF2179 family)
LGYHLFLGLLIWEGPYARLYLSLIFFWFLLNIINTMELCVVGPIEIEKKFATLPLIIGTKFIFLINYCQNSQLAKGWPYEQREKT